jgi:pyridinium-3,5-biscarboxylic acid mononucleotide sulfurtransferase
MAENRRLYQIGPAGLESQEMGAPGSGLGDQLAPHSPAEIQELAERLVGWFAQDGVYVVALSGGVDSAVVAKAASLSRASVMAATARSPSVAGREREDVESLLRLLPIEHRWLETQEITSPEYQRNDVRRCYHCKSHLFAAIGRHAVGAQIVTGTNADDLGDYRPGLAAAEESQVRAPLAELGIGKARVRQLAHHWRLPVADKPASPCLASRIAYGVAVSESRLRMIEQAEEYLRAEFGLTEFRVRLHADELARIEVPLDSLVQFVDNERRERLLACLQAMGFRYVTLDLLGFRSGSLNAGVVLENDSR